MLVLLVALGSTHAHAQDIRVSLTDSDNGRVHVDSANWNEAWIEVAGAIPGMPPLTLKDFVVEEGKTKAEILSVDSVGSRFRSHLAVSFVLDNSSSMFHSYDSLAVMCDSVLVALPTGSLVQAVTFDDERRSESHLFTKRSSVFIAQTGFRDSAKDLQTFWHFFDTIRTRYTPLYDAIDAAVSNVEGRVWQGGDTDRVDVVIVVTDGEDNASRVDIEMLYDVVRTSHVQLFTINFRTGTDGRLIWLAKRTGGGYFYAEDVGELREILKSITKYISKRYHIRYRLPSLSPTPGIGR